MRPRQNSRSASGVDGRPRAQLDPRHQLLAVAVVGHADHLDVLDVGVGVEELLDLPRVHVLAAADHHVLDPPDDVHVAVVGHHGEVAGVHPAVGVDGLGRALGVVPVAPHHGVAPGAELAGLAARQRLAGRRVGDADLDVRVDPPDRGRAVVQRVVGQRLGRHRRRLGHAVADRHLVHVHAVDARLHHLDRARRPGHHAGAQRRQVEALEVRMAELGDEHRRHAVQRRAPLGLHGLEHVGRVERVGRDDHRRPVRRAAEVAHDHAEAVVEGHRDAQPVAGPEALQPGHEVPVVEDVPVGERGALREPGRARRVLDVDRVVGCSAARRAASSSSVTPPAPATSSSQSSSQKNTARSSVGTSGRTCSTMST